MQESLSQHFQEHLPEKPENHPEYVTNLVDLILNQAQAINASDIHLLPSENKMRMDWRIDGVLHHVARKWLSGCLWVRGITNIWKA